MLVKIKHFNMLLRAIFCTHRCPKKATKLSNYSHLSNKLGAHAYRSWKIPLSTFIDSLDFFHPPLLVYCIYVLVFSKNSTLQVYSNQSPAVGDFMEQELRIGMDLGRMADVPAFIASKSFELWSHHIPQKCLYNLWHILMYQKYMKLKKNTMYKFFIG